MVLDPTGPGNLHQFPVGEETSLPRARSLPAALNTSLFLSLNIVCQLQMSRAAKHISPVEEIQARAGQPSGRQAVQQTSPSSTVRWRQVGGGRCRWSAGTESCVSAPRCFWSLALLTSPSADRAKVPPDRYIFPHLHLANSFKSNLHCTQPLFLSPPAGTISKSYLPS